jgi:hypothetical protein
MTVTVMAIDFISLLLVLIQLPMVQMDKLYDDNDDDDDGNNNSNNNNNLILLNYRFYPNLQTSDIYRNSRY